MLPVVALLLLGGAMPTAATAPSAPPSGPASRNDSPAEPIQGQPAPEAVISGFLDTVVLEGLVSPMVVAFDEDDRIFVAEKSGIIKMFDDFDDATPTTWADLRTQVHNFWDRGLLGMALDPDFATNGRIYVAYAHDAAIGGTAPRWGTAGATNDPCPNPPGATADGCVISGRLSRLTAPGGGGLATETVLIEDWCQQFPSHSMGDVVFGPDGALYVSSGDGASFVYSDYGHVGDPVNPCGDPPGGVGGTMTAPTAEGGALRAQDIRTDGDPAGLSGAVIRIDPETGDAMPDNPLGASSDEKERMVIAHGLRNPLRMTFHPDTDELWLGDVGWSHWEEINRHSNPDGAVRNYGWPCREGNNPGAPGLYWQFAMCQQISGQVGPFHTWTHDEEVVDGDGCGSSSSSITGMVFYTGASYPAIYDDALFFADYSRDCIWVMRDANGDGVPEPNTLQHLIAADNPVDLTVGPGGDLYYVDHQSNGAIHRIVQGTNASPVADLQAAPTSGPTPLQVSFDATGSTDPDDDPLSYAWDLDGDGSYDDGFSAEVQRTYSSPQSVTVKVRVRDGNGGQDTESVVIHAGNEPPTAEIDAPTSATTWSVGEIVSFSGTGEDPDEGTLPEDSMEWELIMHHCPGDCHEHGIESFSGVDSGEFEAPDHEWPSHLELRLTVTDSLGAADTASVMLDAEAVDVTVDTDPSGMQVSAGQDAGPGPVTVTIIRNGALQVSAPAQQTFGGTTMYFAAWSDGGAATHMITPSQSLTLIATYTPGFVDIVGSPFEADINWLVAEGITTGCATNPPRYCPSNPVTRAQMASFLVRALDLPAATTDHFSDDETSIHEADINALADAGITTGCGGGRYCPSASVSRAQMASFLVRAFALAPWTGDFFTDDETSIHEADINALAAAGITTGCTATTYCPTQAVTRAQMAAFLRRAIED
jgi:glucose/arabinose dehydrogenase